ncbi:hypothetical protein [Brevundimonas sp. Root1423]|uniref:hypothetical protein n=1 Tax=Brevundimonas sp. Root1423 TaxID=1736462 RepID=UPI00070066C3|nr:hypothetical protein [Brevundimonas sp. Root1423]KQY75269.1 hypothetical protein ASD25_11975 [Brevundimonas sp. Root1423]
MRLILALLMLLVCPAIAKAGCPDLPGSQALLDADADFIVVGEAHGTVELPALFADLACTLTADRRPLLVGVEHGPANQAALDAYMASDGGADARAVLLQASAWNEPGGRGSLAMLELIERVRQLKAAGAKVALVAFDHVIETPGTTELRERYMAAQLMAAVGRSPGARMLALTGLGHADKEGFASQQPPFRSMAQFLPPEDTLTLSFVRAGGEALQCRLTCAAGPMTARDEPRARGVSLGDGRSGFDGWFSNGAILTASTAARPAP